MPLFARDADHDSAIIIYYLKSGCILQPFTIYNERSYAITDHQKCAGQYSRTTEGAGSFASPKPELEVITCLEAMTHSVPLDSEALLARVRTLRVKPSGPSLTDRVLTRLKSQGRP